VRPPSVRGFNGYLGPERGARVAANRSVWWFGRQDAAYDIISRVFVGCGWAIRCEASSEILLLSTAEIWTAQKVDHWQII